MNETTKPTTAATPKPRGLPTNPEIERWKRIQLLAQRILKLVDGHPQDDVCSSFELVKRGFAAPAAPKPDAATDGAAA